MKVVVFLLKLLLLVFGMLLVAGGGAAGLCGVVVKAPDLVVIGALFCGIGLLISIALFRHFARHGKPYVPPEKTPDEGERP